MNRALTTGTMNTDVMMLPDYSGSASVIEPEKMSPMDSLKAIFEDMRDSLNTLVELAQSQGPSAADLRDQDISDADVVPDPGSDTDSQGNSGFPALEMPKIGPKVGLALMLIGLSALFKYGDEIAAALEPVLKYGKEFYDNLSPTGKIGLGVAGLAALVFPGTLTTLVKTGVGLAFDGLKLGFTTMKDAITSMPGLMKAGYQKGKELLGGAFGLLKEGFGKMRDFVMTTVPNALKGAYQGGKKTVMSGITMLGSAFRKMRNFITAQMIPGIAAAYGGVKGKLMGVVGKLAKAFTAMRVFLMTTMIPAITAFMGPFLIPLALLTAAVAAAVAIFVSIKAGIDEFKKSLDEGDSMLVAIVEGVTTALLTLVTLPITLIKNFVAWVAEKLGFEGIAEKLKEFNIVTFIKDGVKNLVLKAKDFVLGLFNLDFKKVLGKFVDIGASIGRVLKGIALGSIAAVKAAFPGGESPMEAFKRVYDEVSNKGNDTPTLPEESDPDDYPGVKSMDARRKEELEANKEKIQDLYFDSDIDEDDRDDMIFDLEQRNRDLYQMLKIENPDLKAAQEMSEANQAPGSNVVTTINNTDASNTNNNSSNNTNTGGLAVTGKDATAIALANVGYNNEF